MTAVHAAVGGLMTLLFAAAGGLGAWRWWRVEPSACVLAAAARRPRR